MLNRESDGNDGSADSACPDSACPDSACPAKHLGAKRSPSSAGWEKPLYNQLASSMREDDFPTFDALLSDSADILLYWHPRHRNTILIRAILDDVASKFLDRMLTVAPGLRSVCAIRPRDRNTAFQLVTFYIGERVQAGTWKGARAFAHVMRHVYATATSTWIRHHFYVHTNKYGETLVVLLDNYPALRSFLSHAPTMKIS